jgi:capsular exopolysaccharide synthesis family protein
MRVRQISLAARHQQQPLCHKGKQEETSMSRVYDALQQCSKDQVSLSILRETDPKALFPDQFTSTVWDPEAAETVDPDLYRNEKLPVLFSAYSFASEQFRLLAARLQQLQHARAAKSVLLTSCAEGDGKSLLVLNLALSLAQGGRQRILLLDGNLRKAALSSMLGIDSRPGLTNWYQTNRSISDSLYRISGQNVWAMPAGNAPVDPLELVKSVRLPELLQTLNGAFDWVLIDSPPLLPLADAEVLSRICEATIIVVRCNKSTKGTLKQALERVAPTKLVGLLLNDFPTNHNGSAVR